MPAALLSKKRKRGTEDFQASPERPAKLTRAALRKLDHTTSSQDDIVRTWTETPSARRAVDMPPGQANGRPPKRSAASDRSSNSRRRTSGSSKSGRVASSSTVYTPSNADTTSTIYDPRVRQILGTQGVFHPIDSNAPQNEAALKAMLRQPRLSLSPSVFDADLQFERFYKQNEQAENETSALQPLLAQADSIRQTYTGGRDVAWSELESLTDNTANLPPPKPDHWDGTRPIGRLDPHAQAALMHHIQPTRGGDAVFPNYSLEGKGPAGKAVHVRTQAVYNGAAGARAMQSGLNYGKATPIFDRHAHALSFTYLDGNIRCYSTHAEPPTGNRAADYHTRQLAGVDMTGSAEQFREGLALLRNARDWADAERSAVIAAVNTAHRQLPGNLSPASPAFTRQPSYRESRRRRPSSAPRSSQRPGAGDVADNGLSNEEDFDNEEA